MKPLDITEHDLNTPGLEHTTYESDTSITFTFTLHKGTGHPLSLAALFIALGKAISEKCAEEALKQMGKP